ncbi:MAG: hypothetical protein AVO35_01160 [Candidatus Aegiribacteria sp. MLS_C]|nr:MAG: hypothetical protein AVO35_01160 [Candidatus Aegiribacteria sp. MLS_C]
MIPLIFSVLLAFGYSPSDSSWNLVTLAEVPEEAVLFAELAAREGGRTVIDFGSLLEVSGNFSRAASVFRVAYGSSDDESIREWLHRRIKGSELLDNVLVIVTRISNTGGERIEEVSVRIPLPTAHPPYQSLEIVTGAFRADGSVMEAPVYRLEPGSTAVLPLVLRIVQVPFTYRPIGSDLESRMGEDGLDGIAGMMRSIQVPEEPEGPGPCLGLAMALRDSAAAGGVALSVTGGLLREPGDTLVFHAWNLLLPDMLPLDVSLFHVDSMRGIAHCPTDVIPLWDLESTEGHEVSAYFSEPDGNLSVSMEASFLHRSVESLFEVFPLSLTRYRR